MGKNLDRIQAAPVKEAFEELLSHAGRCGLEARDLTGFITGIKLYRDEKYVFASQTNPHHLTFYIRRPAIKRWGSMEKRARSLFPDLKLNKSGEVKIHIRTRRHTIALADWLFELP